VVTGDGTEYMKSIRVGIDSDFGALADVGCCELDGIVDGKKGRLCTRS
jgi:hypothetical protein